MISPDTNPAKADASAVEVLRKLEWSGWQNVSDGRTLPCCPICRRFKYPVDSRGGWIQRKGGEHTFDCSLAAALQSSSSAEAELRAELGAALSTAQMNATSSAFWAKRATAAEAERDALQAENEQNKHLVRLLRSDLERFLHASADVTICEGCGAPIGHDEIASTVSDVSGCWGYVADDKKAPCYRYRTEKGADWSWPPCTALSQAQDQDARAAVTQDQGGEHGE